MITAKEARALNPKNAAQNALDAIFSDIEANAKAGKTSVRFPYSLTEIKGEGAVVPSAGVGMMVADALKGHGYVIKDHWDCGQFVDAYLTIEWGEG